MWKKFLLYLILCCSYVFIASADEGMWMLHLLKQQKFSEMRKLGLQLEDYDIYNPDGASLKDAVVFFGRGCTGEVISSKGLVLTNHHCGYGQIQNHSSLENNYLDEGFWAMTKAEELPNPGLTVTFIDRMEDVTDYVKQCLERDKEKDADGVFFLSPSYLNGIARERAGKELLTAPGTEVEIKPFFNGNQYYMFTKKVYPDVRLVGAPPSSIGKFGADTDNWMWPRHTGDFALFRIYADREGNPAAYSPENIPLKPKRWLNISTGGVDENDFAMILGFPGTTHKYYTSWEVAERRDIDNNVRIRMREARQQAMLEEMLDDPAVKIQYASKYSGSTNAYKNAIGTNWAIDLRDFEQLKREQQNRLLEWAEINRRPEYMEALNEIERIVEERADLRYRSWMLNEGIIRGVEFASVPQKGWNMLIRAVDSAKAGETDSLRHREDMERAILQLMEDYSRFADKDYNAGVDRKVSTAMLSEYVGLIGKETQPSFFEHISAGFNGDIEAFVNHIFDRSLFGNSENFNRFASGPEAFLADEENLTRLRNDPMFLFARSVTEESLSLGSQLGKYDIPFSLARRTYLEGILAMDGPYTHFPDANLTLRLTYGQVKGYRPRDAVYYAHQTTLNGVIEKEDPKNWEFVVPERLKELYEENDFGTYAIMGDGRMPVNFVATTHTTGGNSGSPVLNGKGELIGINFDRNWEGVGGDIQYLPDYQRSIIVDIRYVLFVIDRFAGAGHLIEELDMN
ncbi:S46 family peptidase [uncultured Proteiniphilum sp.]|uniref:S46 family peptidase n=1 Tax=uncultured Proteiniphilum sp. TaxID=497637 RepID=UPI002637D5C4|nr:S46 family peptidase [uncultured Proteiniphilum sp.]